MRAIPGWMDDVDFSCELGAASKGNTVYASEEDLRECKPCVKSCGVCEVVVMSKEDFLELLEKSGIDPKSIRAENFGDATWEKEVVH